MIFKVLVHRKLCQQLQLTLLSKDAGEEHVVPSSSRNIIFAPYSDANNVIDKLFKSLRSRYHDHLETSMKGNDFIFNSVQLMYCKSHEVRFIRGGSCIDSPGWIKKKKSTLNPKNTVDKCFQYAATVALSYEEIESYPERVSSTKPFVNKYNWEGINYPSAIDDWKTFEKNNPTIAINILHTKEKYKCPTYISKINSNCEKRIIILMITNGEKEGR